MLCLVPLKTLEPTLQKKRSFPLRISLVKTVWLFEETKRVNSCLTRCSQKKMNNKHYHVLLVFRKNPRKWNYGWNSVLIICTALIAGIFEGICCFNEVILMALTSTEQLFIERPLYRRFLHNDHLSFF